MRARTLDSTVALASAFSNGERYVCVSSCTAQMHVAWTMLSDASSGTRNADLRTETQRYGVSSV